MAEDIDAFTLSMIRLSNADAGIMTTAAKAIVVVILSNMFFKAGIAYRLPVFSVYRGATTTLPLYIQQGFIEVFYEGGSAWDNDGPNDEKNWLNSVGVEFNTSMTIFRFVDVDGDR